ncbi:hypothetical protein EUTSA_v10021859mg [Eutrema salsugineum]|uniref:Uncharacterized protein n=1 Tax=Eutrema salsugineum TaxID=72664 RepID=V4NPA6_EUTSA|nr:hypothetical protein EUTSA_v10021859mg [Eutrema salsugineum]
MALHELKRSRAGHDYSVTYASTVLTFPFNFCCQDHSWFLVLASDSGAPWPATSFFSSPVSSTFLVSASSDFFSTNPVSSSLSL